MNKSVNILSPICLLLIGAFTISGLSVQTFAADGEQLEREIWADMKAGNWAAVEARIAPGFQSVHPDGARDRAQELALIKGLKLGEFKLDRFQVTTQGDNLIVTYWISVSETIAGQHLSTKPAMRQSVWTKTDAGWQWIAHANLNPM